MKTANEKQIVALCNTLMVAVTRTGVITDKTDLNFAVKVMRDELNAFLYGDEYKNERECMIAGTVSQQTVWLSVVAHCVNKIAKLQ